MAQLVARRLAVRRARVRIPAWHPREVSATELYSDDGMEKSLRRARVRIPAWHPREVSATELYSDDGMERSRSECVNVLYV